MLSAKRQKISDCIVGFIARLQAAIIHIECCVISLPTRTEGRRATFNHYGSTGKFCLNVVQRYIVKYFFFEPICATCMFRSYASLCHSVCDEAWTPEDNSYCCVPGKWGLRQKPPPKPTHWFTHQKGVHQYRYFLSSMRTPILLLCAHA